MKNPSTISSGESEERAAFEAWFETVHIEYGASVPDHAWNAWQARAALATQPAESKACASAGEPDYEALEREHLGDPDKQTGIYDPRPAESLGELRHICNLWVDPATRDYVVDRCDHPTSELIAAYTIATPPAAPATGDFEKLVAETWNDPGMAEARAWAKDTLTQAPAATEAPSKPFTYYIHIAAEQRGEFVHDLDEALDDLTNCECKITELFDHPLAAVGASVQPVQPVQPVQSSLSDEQIEAEWNALQTRRQAEAEALFESRVGSTCGLCRAGEFRADSNGYNTFLRCKKCSHVPMFGADGIDISLRHLASSTPTKGGEAS